MYETHFHESLVICSEFSEMENISTLGNFLGAQMVNFVWSKENSPQVCLFYCYSWIFL